MTVQIQRDYWPTADWRESSPQEQRMSPAVLAKLDTYVKETRPYLNTLLIVRHGYVVFERYYKEYDRQSYQLFHSLTKSVISMLIGIALQESYLSSLDQRWEELMPEYFASETGLRKKQITIRQLLKMTSGLNPDFLGYPGHQNYEAEDWIRFAIEETTWANPDQLFLYCSLGSHLLSVIL